MEVLNIQPIQQEIKTRRKEIRRTVRAQAERRQITVQPRMEVLIEPQRRQRQTREQILEVQHTETALPIQDLAQEVLLAVADLLQVEVHQEVVLHQEVHQEVRHVDNLTGHLYY